MCGLFILTNLPILCRHQLRILWFNSILTLITWSEHWPHRSRAQFHRLFPLQTPVTSSGSWGYPHYNPIWPHKSGIPTTIFLGSKIGYNGSRKSGKYVTYAYWFIIMSINELQDEELPQVRSGKVLVTGASVPMELGLSRAPSLGIFTEASSYKHDRLVIQSPTPLSFPEDGN